MPADGLGAFKEPILPGGSGREVHVGMQNHEDFG
eukprot:CAMPEP_0202904406 /NCGR_PEP_ID=MMETSP1392-20130828/29217_1 /ASSEMBLY_ACC=CAM_ASM_000868 /TAXON_ID=225041 /ORGANISM="Chlamydomonas chlamydogama, Strain SAG 11-48b" /LENGTH=33 /DNA_ID= /DNA_START= /DNA_END= /DNA_ORIENTATION=